MVAEKKETKVSYPRQNQPYAWKYLGKASGGSDYKVYYKFFLTKYPANKCKIKYVVITREIMDKGIQPSVLLLGALKTFWYRHALSTQPSTVYEQLGQGDVISHFLNAFCVHLQLIFSLIPHLLNGYNDTCPSAPISSGWKKRKQKK